MIRKDRLDALILLSGDALVCENVELFRNTDTSATPCPRSLDRRIKRLIDREERAREYGSVLHYAKQCAAVFFAVCTVSLALLLSIDEVRAAVWDFIVEFYDDYLAVAYVTDVPAPQIIQKYIEPDVSAFKWEKQVLLESESVYHVRYSMDGKKKLSYTQSLSETESWLDNENSVVERTTVKNYPAVLVFRTDKEVYMLSWSDGTYYYQLSTFTPEITKEDLLSVADTIQ